MSPLKTGDLPSIHNALKVHRDQQKPLILEVEEHMDSNVVRTIAMGSTAGLKRGLVAEDTGESIKVPVGQPTLGRMFNVLGDPIDDKGPLEEDVTRNNIHRKSPRSVNNAWLRNHSSPASRRLTSSFPIPREERLVYSVGPASERTILIIELMRNITKRNAGVVLFAGVGERSREGNDLYLELQHREVMDSTVLVFGQMNEPPGARLRTPLTALTMAEYFRDHEHRPVMVFIDNIFRYIQAGSEVSALLGRLPSEVGYQPTLESEMGSLQERITTTSSGSVTSVQAVYVLIG